MSLLAILVALLPGVVAAEDAAGTAPPSIEPLKSLSLGTGDVAVRIHYLARRPTREAWLTLKRVRDMSTADYQVGVATRAPVAAPLPAPQVPWTEIWQEMTETGFFSLPDENATQPCETEPIPVDAPRIDVEVRQGSHRHHFGYGAPLTRQCPAAGRAATTLRFLQDAFGRALPLP